LPAWTFEEIEKVRLSTLPIKKSTQHQILNWLGKATVAIPLLITFFFAFLTIKNPPVIDGHIENLLVDYRFKIRNLIASHPAPSDVIVVLIDENSLSRYGRWPWNRKLQAELIEKVLNDNPRAAAVDIFYPQSESPENDQALAEVFNKYRGKLAVALGYEVEEGKSHDAEIENVLYDNAISKIENLKYLKAVEAYRVLLPPQIISDSASFGHVYSLPDRDGKLRVEYLYIKYGDEYFPSLALQTARIAMNLPLDQVIIRGGENVILGRIIIPTDEFGRLQINYFGKEGSITHKSAADVLSGNIEKGFFRNKIVLIGTSAMATYDLKITPFSANMPGVEKNATIVANIIEKNFIRKTPLFVDLIIVLLAGISTVFISYRLNALTSIIALACLSALIVITNLTAFIYGLRMNLVYPLFTTITCGVFIISHRYFIEEKKAREIRKMFSSYVTERVVNELIKNPEMAKLGGERREITVLFSDISGFTSFSEKHEPEDVVAMLNEYLGAMTDVIFRWDGTLDKFIGDAIVAFWGAPMKQEDHAELAVRCSLHMIKRLGELRQKWLAEGKTPLNIGIGLNTGEVIVGNIGAEGKKMDYTVIGDHVNIGARVEALTRMFSANILMTELPLKKIIELVKTSGIGHISIKGVGNFVVKGKARPIKIYEIRALEPSAKSTITECEDETILHLKEK
jgi:adenylate cyclase